MYCSQKLGEDFAEYMNFTTNSVVLRKKSQKVQGKGTIVLKKITISGQAPCTEPDLPQSAVPDDQTPLKSKSRPPVSDAEIGTPGMLLST